MHQYSPIHFYPRRIVWIGSLILALGFFLALPCLRQLQKQKEFSLTLKGEKDKSGALPCRFSLGLKEEEFSLAIPNLRGELIFSLDPPRPGEAVIGKHLLVRLSQSGESKRVILPCRLDLEFHKDQLSFAKKNSPFWVELSFGPSEQIEIKAFISDLEGKVVGAGSFYAKQKDCPLRRAEEFLESSPFRILSEAKFLGKDQLSPFSSSERIEIIPGEVLEISAKDWLVWKEGKWQKSKTFENEIPIAHLESAFPKEMILEGWGKEGYARMSLGLSVGPPFKKKGEDFLSAIRIRSEKQISCMIEKQCIVLKIDDWVLKMGGRWKILRKKEDRDAFLKGKLNGELFILERILQKQGQKMIQGRLFNPERTQVVSIEMAAQSSRKTKDHRRGKVS